jgi:hypothetical protein
MVNVTLAQTTAKFLLIEGNVKSPHVKETVSFQSTDSVQLAHHIPLLILNKENANKVNALKQKS